MQPKVGWVEGKRHLTRGHGQRNNDDSLSTTKRTNTLRARWKEKEKEWGETRKMENDFLSTALATEKFVVVSPALA